ncbi:MAG: hypothetical protein HYY64_03405, partial [Candidatus Rokubacteria bacterium]|nr:hypothetical protein [Candidatus Rokubacteria bacterium]
HFHNPLRPFSSSGVTDLPPFIQGACSATEFDQTFSSVLWGTRFTSPQERGPGAGNPFDWDAARSAYLDALILPTSAEREAALARTFETLGHVMHLVQDLAVPAHVRDDFQSHLQHLNPLAGFGRWTENGFERFVRRNPQLVDAAAAKAGEFPISFSRQLVTRFWDTDLYTGAVPSKETDQGLAEYTNANFASQYTILTESFSQNDPKFFPYPRESETNLHAVVAQALSVRAFTAEDNKVDVGLYITKEGSGQKVDNFARLGYLWSDIPPDQLRLSLQLDDIVNADYATLLLPRAIAYSEGLLDYFFRGRLDVDLVPADPSDPSVVRVSGANASPDALLGGTLTLYADDPADPAGKRDPAAALDQDLTVTVESGAPVESARFRVPENAERFMAVYEGTLGLEKQEGAFPGAVVAKALGGVRVEEVFSDGTRWKLRTPRGVFFLPGLTAAGFEEVRWGDGDNLLVAQTPFGLPDPNQPNLNRVVLYEVQRVSGSVEVKTVTTPDGPEVQIREIDAVDFPFGMPLGTTVNFSQTIQYRQRLARIDPHRNLFQWVPRFPFRPQDGTYEFAGEELGTLTLETAVEDDVHFSGSFPVTLDVERSGSFGTVDRPYVWYLQEVAADVSGRILAVVVVYLTSPQSPGTALPYFGVNQQGAREVISQVSFAPSFPSQVSPLLWAVVDLKARAVVASTADPVITLTVQDVSDALPDVYVHGSLEFLGGPTPSVQEIPWNRSRFGPVDPSRPTAVDAELETRAGALAIGVTGWLEDELALSGVFDFQLGALRRADEFTYDCGADATLSFFCRAVSVTSSTGVVTRGPAHLQDARRSRPAPPGGERVALLVSRSSGLDESVLVWDPATPSARVLLRLPAIAESGYFVGPVTQDTAMVVGAGQNSFLISLAGAAPATPLPGDLSDSFTLLNPSYLYSVQDMKFYRPRPQLQPTALPARLADVPGNPVGDHHAIRLP